MALPFFFLVLLEVGLRLAGYGFDPAFFKTERDPAGQQWLVNHDSFMFRFFPPHLARWPGAFRIAAQKPPDVQRIFVFGESAAMGDPQPSVGPAHILEVLLRERFPQQKFEVINLGITAINSHVILPLARDVAARGQGDLWIIYMGNNEMVGPFGAASVFGDRAAPLPWVRFNLALQRTRVGQLAVAFKSRLIGGSSQSAWGGMEMFLQNQVPPEDVRRKRVYQNFERNLRDIVSEGRRTGAKIALCTMAVNLRDCPPFASLADSNLPAADRRQFDALYTNALRFQTDQQCDAATPLFAQAARLDTNHAELQFRWATCQLMAPNPGTARATFQRACDVDALPFRADSRINGSIRSVAQEQSGTGFALCDAEAALAAAAPQGIAGDESFFEHVHFNFDGNYRIAKAWAEQVANLLPVNAPPAAAADWASQEFCERAIGLSDWNRGLVVGSVLARMRLPPLANQFNNATRAQRLQRELNVIAERQRQTNAVTRAAVDFAAAVADAPEDTLLRANYGKFLELVGDREGALREYLKITEQLPHDFHATVQTGRLLGQQGKLTEAGVLLQRAAAQRPTLPDAWFELGTVLAGQASYREALECFERVIRMHPADVACLIHRARMLSKLNRRAEAMEQYRKAIALDGNNWNARLELAEELVVANQADEAIREYFEAARLNPRHPVLRINLGVMLARQNRLDEAIQQFEATLQLEPTNAVAADYLRQVGARRDALGR